MAIKYLSEAPQKQLRGTALLRLDFNTKDDWRMRAVLPTIKLLLETASKIVIVSHRGRPKKFDKNFSLKNDATALSRLLEKKVIFIGHFRFGDIQKTVASAPRGSIFLLENLRFMKGEEINDRTFAKRLASLADFYVNDAFAVSHRANASIAAVAEFLPSYAGMELADEIKFLSRAMARPRRPLTLVLGGAKAADKLGVIRSFKNKADWFLLGGGPANTMLWLKGMNVKNSLRDKNVGELKALKPFLNFKKIVLPEDFVWHNGAIVDFKAKTIKMFTGKVRAARTIIWSGPLGLIEKPEYAKSTLFIARAIVKNRGAFSIAGGGETVMFLKKYGLDKEFSFISTGGGAMLDFLAGKKLPGIEALR